MSVLVNGSPTQEFSMSCGLRQGDPLSPLLFIIIGQMLHLLLVRASDVGLIEGISMGNGPKLMHL